MTLSIAIIISLLISLTTTPKMCALSARARASRRFTPRHRVRTVLAGYERSLGWALVHRRIVLAIFFAAVALNAVLFYVVPKGFFPEEDTGRLFGILTCDQSVSFHLMSDKLKAMMAIVQADPAVDNVVGFTGAGSGFGGSANTGSAFDEAFGAFTAGRSGNRAPATRLAKVPGGRLYLGAVQDIRAGGSTEQCRVPVHPAIGHHRRPL